MKGRKGKKNAFSRLRKGGEKGRGGSPVVALFENPSVRKRRGPPPHPSDRRGKEKRKKKKDSLLFHDRGGKGGRKGSSSLYPFLVAGVSRLVDATGKRGKRSVFPSFNIAGRKGGVFLGSEEGGKEKFPFRFGRKGSLDGNLPHRRKGGLFIPPIVGGERGEERGGAPLFSHRPAWRVFFVFGQEEGRGKGRAFRLFQGGGKKKEGRGDYSHLCERKEVCAFIL